MRKILATTTLASALVLAAGPSYALDVSAGGSVGGSAGVSSGDRDSDRDSGGGLGASAGGSLGASVGLSSGSDDRVSIGGSGAVNTDVDTDLSTGASASSSGNLDGTASVDAESVVGADLVTLSGTTVGVVSDITSNASGETFLTADVGADIGLGVEQFLLPVRAAVMSDQQVQIQMTDADLRTSLSAKAEANGNLTAE